MLAVVIPMIQMEKLRSKVTHQEVLSCDSMSSSKVTKLNCLLRGIFSPGPCSGDPVPVRRLGRAARLQELTGRSRCHLGWLLPLCPSGSLWVSGFMAGLSRYPHWAPEEASIHGTFESYHRAVSPGR